ncbi:MAG: MFS transporter [Candidatus Xenobia bacterium]
MFRALRHRDYRLFWMGQTISQLGGWMQTVGLAWLVLELTDSPFMLGLIFTLQYAPHLVMSLPAGALADRFPKRKLVLVTNLALALISFTLALLIHLDQVQFWQVALLTGLTGLVSSLEVPARHSYQIVLVGRHDLMNAVALNSASFNLARIAGPALAGVLIARMGVEPTFFLNALSFVPLIWALLLIRSPGLPEGQHQSVLTEVKEGLSYAWRTPQVSIPLRLMLVISVCVINHTVLVPLLARDVLQGGPEAVGWLFAALGVGALAGGLLVAAEVRQRPAILSLALTAVLLSVLYAAVAPVHTLAPAMALLFLLGFVQIRFTVGCNSILQVVTPDPLRGRVLSLYSLVFLGSTPVGSLLSGLVAQTWGVAAAYALGGLVAVMAVLALSPALQTLGRVRRRRRSLRVALRG